MERWRGRVAVVTGASSGIGAAIAAQLQDAGMTVVGVARRADQVPEAVQRARREAEERGRSPPADPVPGQLHARAMDVTQEGHVADTFRWLKDTFGRVDVLINNAGIISGAPLTENHTSSWRHVLDVNVLGLSMCTREAVQLMREREDDEGYILNIGSVVGHMNWVKESFSMYVASKNAVRVLSESLRKELVLLKSQIKVTHICPGFVKTDLISGLDFNADEWFQMPHIFPEDIADAVLYVLGTARRVHVTEMLVKPFGEML